ncbi:MAG: metal-dependent hydrolase [Nanoarchaeota archaeon]
MPLTPYHVGIALLIGVLLYKYLDLYSILVGSVILDAWPFTVLFFSLPYRLHGISHSFIFGILVAIIISLVRYKFNNFLKSKKNLKIILISSFIGISSHILLDSPLYKDMVPFWPSSFNPFYNLFSYSDIILFCIVSFILSGVIFIIKFRRKFYK